MNCRVLKSKQCEITQNYGNNGHLGVDIVGPGYTLDDVVAHSDGRVIVIQDGMNNLKGSTGNASYGNFVKIDHGNGYATLYAHMQKGLYVKNGEYVKEGQLLGHMSDSGNAYGAHTHFEVWKEGSRINPEPYLDKMLYEEHKTETKYKIGDVVEITGVYVSSDSSERLNPAITKGTITKIIEGARNPYLLDDGNIGWVNDSCIRTTKKSEDLKPGDKVEIIATGNGSSYGTSNTAYGLGWTRRILNYLEGRPFPYQVGDDSGTTGFYSKSALRKVE